MTRQDVPYKPYEPPGGPLRFKLADDTERMLGLPYPLYRWPGTGRYESQLSFSSGQYPSRYDESRSPGSGARADEALLKYERLLFPHGRAHVEVHCTVAFVHTLHTEGYGAIVNGTVLSSFVDRSEVLYRRMQRLGLGQQACVAAAQIRGGGLMPDGRRRGYFVAIDVKRFPGRSYW
jgi:hypothetical protein